MVPSHTQPAQPVLSCRDVEKLYGSRDNVTRALDGVSFDVAAGEYVAIMGPSGSGKTTLLNCISTIDRPTSGHIYVDGQDITALRPGQLSKFRRERLGFVFQDSNLLDTLTARENIALALTINHTPAKEVTARVAEITGLDRARFSQIAMIAQVDFLAVLEFDGAVAAQGAPVKQSPRFRRSGSGIIPWSFRIFRMVVAETS